MLAVQVAQARDMLRWYGAFASLVFPLLLHRAWKTKNHAFAAPIVPIRYQPCPPMGRGGTPFTACMLLVGVATGDGSQLRDRVPLRPGVPYQAGSRAGGGRLHPGAMRPGVKGRGVGVCVATCATADFSLLVDLWGRFFAPLDPVQSRCQTSAQCCTPSSSPSPSPGGL